MGSKVQSGTSSVEIHKAEGAAGNVKQLANNSPLWNDFVLPKILPHAAASQKPLLPKKVAAVGGWLRLLEAGHIVVYKWHGDLPSGWHKKETVDSTTGKTLTSYYN